MKSKKNDEPLVDVEMVQQLHHTFQNYLKEKNCIPGNMVVCSLVSFLCGELSFAMYQDDSPTECAQTIQSIFNEMLAHTLREVNKMEKGLPNRELNSESYK